MKRVFLLAGEASGDLHGSLLARALRARRSDLDLCGVGGPRMRAAGVRLLIDSGELAVVGLTEVLAHAGRVLEALDEVRGLLGSARPDLFVPIDYPDFNFRLLPAAARLGIPVAYYISPQLWAWRRGRLAMLKRYVRRMVVIFPFEEELYRREGIPVTWVGHPLIDLLAAARSPEEERAAAEPDSAARPVAGESPVVALLPGSRRSEVSRIAPALLGARRILGEARRGRGLPPVRWILGRAPWLPADLDRLFRDDREGAMEVMSGVDALRRCDLALVASGTATLEACLLGRPIVVVYRMSRLTHTLARRLIRVEHIAMANLLAGRRLVPELVQDEASPERVALEAGRLLEDPGERMRIRREMGKVRERLGPPGAAERAAEAVLEAMEGR